MANKNINNGHLPIPEIPEIEEDLHDSVADDGMIEYIDEEGNSDGAVTAFVILFMISTIYGALTTTIKVTSTFTERST